MALTNNGTKVSLNSTKVPSTYTLPSVTNLSSSQPTYSDFSLTIAKSTVENASEAVTFAAIVAAITAAVTTKLEAELDDAVKTIVCNADLTNIKDNQDFADDFYNSTVQSYICTIDIYINIS